MFTERSTGDKAVPFAFTDAQRLVMWQGELRPLQAVISGSDAESVLGHKLQRYGPGGIGVMVTLDEGFTERILVPDDANEEDTTHLSLRTIGQFVNDHAFGGAAALREPDAMWEYERQSDAANVLTLAWSLQMDDQRELVPHDLQLISNRDLQFSEPGVSVELGLHYGVQYWRELVERGIHLG
jgi:hypothetical protein